MHPIPRFYSYVDDIPAPSYGVIQIFSIPSSRGFGLTIGHGDIFYIRSGFTSKNYSWEVKRNTHSISRVTNENSFLSDKIPSYVYYLEITGESAKEIQEFTENKLMTGRTFEAPNYPKATFNEFVNQGSRTFTRPSTAADRVPRAITASLAAFVMLYSSPYILGGIVKCVDFLSEVFNF